jgi:hypothetical protein
MLQVSNHITHHLNNPNKTTNRDLLDPSNNLQDQDSPMDSPNSTNHLRASLNMVKDNILLKDSLMAKDSLLMDKDSLLMAKDSLLMDKDSLLMDKDSLLMDKDSLLMDKDSLLMDKDSLLMARGHINLKDNLPMVNHHNMGTNNLLSNTATHLNSPNMGTSHPKQLKSS